MRTDNSALIYFREKIYYKFLKNLIEKNISLEDISKELKEVGLESEGINKSKVEKYIKKYLGKSWDDNKKIWEQVEAQQLNMIDEYYEFEFKKPWDNNNMGLSENDTKTILKDMKIILSSVKKITNDIDKVVESINTIAVSLSSRSDLNDK